MESRVQRREGRVGLLQKIIFLSSLWFLIVGTAGYFSMPRDHWAFYLFAHLGAVGIMGLSGSVAGALAGKKNRNYWAAYCLGSLMPIVLGIVSVLVFMLGEGGQLTCGGSVSLGIAILVIGFYSLVKVKTPQRV